MSTPQVETRCLHFSTGLPYTPHETSMATGAGSGTLRILFCFFWVWACGKEGTWSVGRIFNKTPVVNLVDTEVIQDPCCRRTKYPHALGASMQNWRLRGINLVCIVCIMRPQSCFSNPQNHFYEWLSNLACTDVGFHLHLLTGRSNWVQLSDFYITLSFCEPHTPESWHSELLLLFSFAASTS